LMQTQTAALSGGRELGGYTARKMVFPPRLTSSNTGRPSSNRPGPFEVLRIRDVLVIHLLDYVADLRPASEARLAGFT